MRIPTSLKIKNQTWNVKYKSELFGETGKELNGECDPADRVIWLREPNMQVFLHEYVHAILAEYKFYVTSLTPDVEEFLCEFIADELTSSFKISKK